MADSSVTAFAFSRHVSEIHGYPPTELDLNLGSNFSANCRRLASYCRKGSQEFHVDAPTIGSDGWVARISRRLQRSSMLRILMIALIPRGRMKTIALGLTLGILVSAVSWLENLRGMESHVVSAFPHVLILIVLPAAPCFEISWRFLWPAIDAALGHRLSGPPLRHSWPLTLPKLSITSMVALLMA